MASTYLSLNVHVIFATKDRAPMIADEWQGDLHAYVGGIVRTLGGRALAVGGVADHIHLLAAHGATHCVADFVREVKKGSSVWAAERHADFSWQIGYAAFSVSPLGVERVVEYIAHQQEHHRKFSSTEELKAIMAEFGMEYDERYFE